MTRHLRWIEWSAALYLLILWFAFAAFAPGGRAQSAEKIKTEYTFWLSLKGPELVFRVALDNDNVPKSVSVYRPGEAAPFQTMENCAYSSVEVFPTDRYPDLELLRTADFNFDGYQDLMLVGYANSPHLGNTFYCVWLWEPKEEKFKVLPGAGDISDPTPDPATKTIRSHRDYIGGPEVDELYAWEKGALVLVESRRREYSSAIEGCGEYVVETRKNGAMVQVRDEIVEPGVDEIVPCKSAKKLP
ncbi:MAG TPA: hypothetical protein VEG64_15060 [Candidatus Sulfotelmatobacter sp.]|nr:hypothetical protein [Candidatus Sulfotelmatobacter sp.]